MTIQNLNPMLSSLPKVELSTKHDAEIGKPWTYPNFNDICTYHFL